MDSPATIPAAQKCQICCGNFAINESKFLLQPDAKTIPVERPQGPFHWGCILRRIFSKTKPMQGA
jgi:hypothetical protein